MKQEQHVRLSGNLSLVSVTLFGIAYMTPGIVVSTFGVIAVTSHGSSPTAYVLATAAMLLTGLGYAKMARVFPASGSVYTYARKMLGPRIGFLAGWAMLLDYFFLPMVAWLVGAIYLHAQFPVLPIWAWLIINIALTTAVNVAGLTIADRVNKVLMTLAISSLIVLVWLCVHFLATTPHGPAAHAFWNPATTGSAITAAAAIAAYSFLGFDAVTTLSEETRDPTRTIPRAILLTVAVGGALFVIVSFLLQWVHPGSGFTDESSAGFAMAELVGGRAYAEITNIVSLLGGFAATVAIQASTSRILYVMGRDGVLPRRFFGHLHPKLRTPVRNLLLIAAVALLATNLSLAEATSFINFGAFLGFALVNICVVAYAVRQRRAGTKRPWFGYVVLPIAGAAIDVYLLTRLSVTATCLGLAWLLIGAGYLAVITKGFRATPPEFTPDKAPREHTGFADATQTGG